MTDTQLPDIGTPAPTAGARDFTFDLPADAGSFTIDLAAIPPEAREALLKSAVKTAIGNRVNVAAVRFNKANAPFVLFDEYAKYEADPISNAKPEGDKPTVDLSKRPEAVDLRALAQSAADSLLKGVIGREKSDKPARAPRDPVDALVTQTVRSELIAKNKANNAKYGLTDANKELAAFGGSGLKFLADRIEKAVAAGGDKAALEKMLETRYVGPARVMAGVKPLGGKSAELPNIL